MTEPGLSLKERFALLPRAQREALLAATPPDTLEEMARGEWWWTSRPDQVPPPGAWLIYLVLSGRGWGKALPLDTPIPTPSGWTNMGDLDIGDFVLSGSGKPTRVAWTSPVQLGNSCYRVTFGDGASIVADGCHLWSARSRADRRAGRGYRTVSTEEMLRRGLVVSRERNWQMPAAPAIELPDADLPVDPYVLGFWLGDGSSAGSSFAIGDQDCDEMASIFMGRGLAVRRNSGIMWAPEPIPSKTGADGRFASNGSLKSLLVSIGVVKNKHIPEIYLRSGLRQRSDLLAGLIDSDGYVERSTGRIEVTSTRENLARQVAELAMSLGHRARVYRGVATLNGVATGPKYRVVWVARHGGGLLSRKQISGRSELGQPDRLTTRYVEAIDPVPSVPVRCIGVEDPDRLFLAGSRFLVTHNSRSGSEWIVQRTLDHPSDISGSPTERLVIAETLSDARDVCIGGPSGILRVLERRGVRFRYVRSPKPQIRFLDSGCLIHASGADDADVGRGYNLADVWMDEFAKWPMPSEAWTEGIMPALRANLSGDHPRAFVTTTPKPIQVLREWVSDNSGDIIVIRGSTYDNKANLSRASVAAMRKKYEGTSIGAQELHGALLDDITGRVFSHSHIAGARIAKLEDCPSLVSIVVGIDPGLTGKDDETGIVVVGADEAGDWYVLADRTIQGAGREAARTAWLTMAEYNATRIIVETNLGKRWMTESFSSVYEELVSEGVLPHGVPPINTVDAKVGKKTRAEPVGMRCEQGRLHMVGVHNKLEQQMVEFDPCSKRDSPDRVDALVHACRYHLGRERRRVSMATPLTLLQQQQQQQQAPLAVLDRFDDFRSGW